MGASLVQAVELSMLFVSSWWGIGGVGLTCLFSKTTKKNGFNKETVGSKETSE